MAQAIGATGLGLCAGRLRLAVFAVLVAVIAACSPIYRNHGYVPAEEDLALLTVGRDSRETVEAVVGRPSAEALLNDTAWYYVQSTWVSTGPASPKEEVRQVVVISFDDTGVVENIERFGLEKGRVVPISRRVTESNIKGQSFLRQLFGNLGAIRTDQLLKK